MKILTLLLFLCSISVLAQHENYLKWEELAKNDINLQPEYGNAEKTQAQIQADEAFVKEMLSYYGTKEKACNKMIDTGFNYLYQKGDYPTAMKRFNQAFLLNPNHADIYYGYGTIYY